jgi:hypothetical protein
MNTIVAPDFWALGPVVGPSQVEVVAAACARFFCAVVTSAPAPAIVAVGEQVVAEAAPPWDEDAEEFDGPAAPVDFDPEDVVEQAARATVSSATDTNLVVPRADGLITAS